MAKSPLGLFAGRDLKEKNNVGLFLPINEED